MATRKELQRILRSKYCGFVFEQELQDLPSQDIEIIRKELEHGNRIGVYVYRNYTEIDNKLVFTGMKLGYYVRSLNPFSWQHKKVCGY